MKRSRLLLLLASFIIYFSCEKSDLPFVPCAIKQVITIQPGYSGPGALVVNDFTYTHWGAPEKIITSYPGTGNPHYEFRYDKKHRLIQLLAYFSAQNPYTTTNYVYGNNGLIETDTTFLTNTPSFRFVTRYFYDTKYRISKTEGTSSFGFNINKEYNYDIKGNLIVGPGAV